MVDTARWGYPADMSRAKADPSGMGRVESWIEDAGEKLRSFAREKPDQAMLWALGIGFVLGWKLKPW